MFASRKDYLFAYPYNSNYDMASKEVADHARKLDNPEEMFNLLNDTPNLVLVSRSAVDDTVQAFFYV